MKEYNAKIIVNNDELKILFECDKEKNINCKGNGNCRECNHTTNSRYARATTRVAFTKGKHSITDKEVIEALDNEIEYYRHKIQMLERIKDENTNVIDSNEKLIQELREVLIDITFKCKDICDIKTPNQIRKLLGFETIN